MPCQGWPRFRKSGTFSTYDWPRGGGVVVWWCGGVVVALRPDVGRFSSPKMHPRAPHRAVNYFQAMAAAVTLVDVLSKVHQAHTLIAECFGPELELDGLQHPDLYVFRRASREICQLSYYDSHWHRQWSFMCLCRGPFENGCGCSLLWRQKGWICPLVLQYL